jgi:cytochrome bd-type quinol oxidase subunit 1
MNLYDSNPAFWSRVRFGFTITCHYLFPQLTMRLSSSCIGSGVP